MILLNIDEHKDSGYLYQQIYKELKKKILARDFNAHEKLPSKRLLAGQLNVSLNTVTNAYEQLLAEGYIYTVERSGYYVEDIAHFTKISYRPTNIPEDLKEKQKNNSDWLSLSHMTADITLFPFKEWLKCKREAIANHEQELTDISHPQGPFMVRKTISQLIALTRGVVCEPEQIVISAGTQPLIKQLMAIQKDSPIIAMEDPGYSRIYSLLTRLNIQVEPISLDKKGMDIQKVDQTQTNFLFVTPSHQFPTGKIMPISRRIELLNWAAKKNDRYIIEDDYDSEFKYKTDNIPSLQSLDQHQRVIYMGTFSKSLMPSLRISYMVLPTEMLRIYRDTYSDIIPYNNTLTLYTLHYFINSGAYNRHIKRMNLHYENKRDQLLKNLQKKFKNKIKIEDIQAGLHFLATFKTKKSYDDIEKRSKHKNLEIYSMRRFILKNTYKNNNEIVLIIGFANINTNDIPEAVERLHSIIMD